MNTRRGFSICELAAVVVAVVCVMCVAAVGLGGQPDGAGDDYRKSRDKVQVRGIHQGLVVWAQNNGDQYPMPSKIDAKDFSVADRGALKNTTASIYSLLVFNGTISTEMLVSPVEKSPSIKVYDKYEFDSPRNAVKPAMAVWDPKFGVDFTEGKIGGASYAHLQPSSGRLPRWSNTFVAGERVVGMRGPEVSSVTKNEDGSVTPTFANPKSNTFAMYDADVSWSGHIAANDNAVEFQEHVLAVGKPVANNHKGRRYKDEGGQAWPDLWNYDEPDDAKGVNDYLGIFVRAGAKAAEFKAIWD